MVRAVITREVSPAINQCELTHLRREPIDSARAAAQHRQYELCVAALRWRIDRIPADPHLPDSVFVEDTPKWNSFSPRPTKNRPQRVVGTWLS